MDGQRIWQSLYLYNNRTEGGSYFIPLDTWVVQNIAVTVTEQHAWDESPAQLSWAELTKWTHHRDIVQQNTQNKMQPQPLPKLKVATAGNQWSTDKDQLLANKYLLLILV